VAGVDPGRDLGSEVPVLYGAHKRCEDRLVDLAGPVVLYILVSYQGYVAISVIHTWMTSVGRISPWFIAERHGFGTYAGTSCTVNSDVPGLAWPESPGLGLASEGSGLAKPQARPRPSERAWPGLGLGLGQGLWLKM
jgi:hypothetical protein